MLGLGKDFRKGDWKGWLLTLVVSIELFLIMKVLILHDSFTISKDDFLLYILQSVVIGVITVGGIFLISRNSKNTMK